MLYTNSMTIMVKQLDVLQMKREKEREREREKNPLNTIKKQIYR